MAKLCRGIWDVIRVIMMRGKNWMLLVTLTLVLLEANSDGEAKGSVSEREDRS